MLRYASVSHLKLCAAFLCFLFLAGCQAAYYQTMESLGYHKRDIMVNRVESARDAQKEAKEQFESALQRFISVMNFNGGALEEKYEVLKDEYEKSRSKAKKVKDRIDKVQEVAEALFDEWESELDEYTDKGLRRSSERKLNETRRQYSGLMNAMRRAEKKIQPVLNAFKDQVLFLKHNLNARAIASLRDELASVESDVASLIREMEESITEADSFIQAMSAK